jgi:hypothetical protein
MADFFASGHAADLILGVLLIEAAWLRLGRGWSWAVLTGLLGPAALIVLGLRAALRQAQRDALDSSEERTTISYKETP